MNFLPCPKIEKPLNRSVKLLFFCLLQSLPLETEMKIFLSTSGKSRSVLKCEGKFGKETLICILHYLNFVQIQFPSARAKTLAILFPRKRNHCTYPSSLLSPGCNAVTIHGIFVKFFSPFARDEILTRFTGLEFSVRTEL